MTDDEIGTASYAGQDDIGIRLGTAWPSRAGEPAVLPVSVKRPPVGDQT